MEKEILATLHQAMSEATQSQPHDGPMETYTFRIHPNTLKNIEGICKSNGTTLPKFIRKCCEIVEREYRA